MHRWWRGSGALAGALGLLLAGSSQAQFGVPSGGLGGSGGGTSEFTGGCYDEFPVPDDPEQVSITDLEAEIRAIYAVTAEDDVEGVDGPAMVLEWAAIDRSSRIRPHPSAARFRLFVTFQEDEDSPPRTEGGCDEIEFDLRDGEMLGRQVLPMPSNLTVPIDGLYSVSLEVAQRDDRGYVRERQRDNNSDTAELPYHTELVAEDFAAESSGSVRFRLVNSGNRPTEPLKVRVVSDGASREVDVETIPAAPQDDEDPEEDAEVPENFRDVQLTLDSTGARVSYTVHEVPTERRILEGDGEVTGGGTGGTGGSLPGVPGSTPNTGTGSNPGTGTPTIPGTGSNPGGGSTAPPPTPTGQGEPDYKVENMRAEPQSARDAVFRIYAEVTNQGGPYDQNAPVRWELQGATSAASSTSQGNAVLEGGTEEVLAIPPGQSRTISATLDLSAETDPERQANQATSEISVDVSGDRRPENNTASRTLNLPGQLGEASRPPVFEISRFHVTHVPPSYSFEAGRLIVYSQLLNVGGPATSVSWTVELDEDGASKVLEFSPVLTTEVGQGEEAQLVTVYDIEPRFYVANDALPKMLDFRLAVQSTYRGEGGAETDADAQELTMEDQEFLWPYPRVDLSVMFVAGDMSTDEELTEESLQVYESKNVGVAIVNSGPLPIRQDIGYTIEFQDPCGLTAGGFGGGMTGLAAAGVAAAAGSGGIGGGQSLPGGGTGNTGVFTEDVPSGGQFRLPEDIQITGNCDHVNGGGTATLSVTVGFDRSTLDDVPEFIDDNPTDNSSADLNVTVTDNGTCEAEQAAGAATGLGGVGQAVGVANTAMNLANGGGMSMPGTGGTGGMSVPGTGVSIPGTGGSGTGGMSVPGTGGTGGMSMPGTGGMSLPNAGGMSLPGASGTGIPGMGGGCAGGGATGAAGDLLNSAISSGS